MYIKSICYGGIDYHDSKETIKQLKWNDDFDIPKDQVNACICNDILKKFLYADEGKILAALERKKRNIFPITHMEDRRLTYGEYYHGRWSDEAEISGNKLEEYYSFGQVYYETEYTVRDIKKENICYIPEEQFYAMYKGMPLVERFYHEPFKNYKDAEEFMNSMKKHEPESEFIILAHDYLEIIQTEWYKENMKVIEELRAHPEKKDIFHILVKEHLEEIKRG